LFTLVLLPVGFSFYKHLLHYDQYWILSSNLYVMSCLYEVAYKTVRGSVCYCVSAVSFINMVSAPWWWQSSWSM